MAVPLCRTHDFRHVTVYLYPYACVCVHTGFKKYAVILAFDVSVSKEARELAEEFGVRIFTADIIYHLFDQFKVRV